MRQLTIVAWVAWATVIACWLAVSCYTPPKPRARAQPVVSTNEVVAIEELWLELRSMGFQVKTLSDTRYKTPVEADLAFFYSKERAPWVPERYDCDDTAFAAHAEALQRHRISDRRLLGLAVGIIAWERSSSEAHMAQVVRLRDGRWRVFDVRTWELLPLPAPDKIIFFTL